MNKTCKNCNQNFESENIDYFSKFSIKINSNTFPLTESNLCDSCNQQSLMTFRNEKSLYHRKCDLSGKQIISNYAPNTPYKVYEQSEWWSDKWDSREYGKEYNFNRPFFDQLNDLMQVTPLINLVISSSENSSYTNYTVGNKNCYLLFASDYNDNCYYSNNIFQNSNTIDCLFIINSEYCYECIDCEKCYRSSFLKKCKSCSDCIQCEECNNCNNCLCCINLRNKDYHFLNRKIIKKEYDEIIHKYNNEHEFKIRIDEEFRQFKIKQVYKYANIINCENSTGDFINNCKDAINCYDLVNSNDCINTSLGISSIDCYKSIGTAKSELVYMCTACPENYNILFSAMIWPGSKNVYYSYSLANSQNCFGCVSSNRNQYCILNKQYSKEEYEILVPKIIDHMRSTGEWGEFMPPRISPFGYNETIAQDYYPLTKEEALNKGYKWKDDDASSKYQGVKYLIPDNIKDVKDDITSAILECEISGRPYKIIPQELKFYREMNLPIPRICPDERHKARMKLRNPRKLFDRNCMKCNAEIKTTYEPNRPEIVYCEECYLNTVY